MKAQEQKKPDLKTRQAAAGHLRRSQTAATTFRATRANSPGCMRGGAAGWHDGCLRTGAMIATRRGQERAGAGVFAPGSNQRDGEAAGLHTTAHCLTLIPRRRVPLAGSVGAKRIKVGGTTKRTMCVVCCPGSKADAQPRNEVRSVASAVPSCQPAA